MKKSFFLVGVDKPQQVCYNIDTLRKEENKMTKIRIEKENLEKTLNWLNKKQNENNEFYNISVEKTRNPDYVYVVVG